MNQETPSATGRHTSSYSMNGSGQCFEVAWRISSYSMNTDGNCVEAGPLLHTPGQVAVRDSTQRDLGFLSFPSAEWHAFLDAATGGVL